MATSTIFNFNFNNSEIVDSTGQWYDATTGTPTTEFIEHDGNTALFQPARTNGGWVTPNPTMLRSYDPNFSAYTYTLEVQVCAVLNQTSNRFLILNFPINEGGFASALGLFYNDNRTLEMWIDYASEGYTIHPVLIDFSTAGFDRWFSVRIERTVDPNNPYIGATVKAYVDGAEVYDQTFTYAQSTIRGKIGPRLQYCESMYATGGIAIDNLKLTAGIAPSSVVDVSLANLQRNNANLLSFIKGKVPTVNDGTLTIKVNGATAGTFTANQSTAATANITVPTAVSELTNDSGYLTASSNLDASKLTSGTVDIARLPQGALERLVKVANEAARYALTTADVQLGDTVQQLDTGIMYVVTDADHLDSAAGYTEYTAGTAASVPWSGVTGKPTFAAVATSGAYSDLTGTPALAAVATSGAYSDLTGTPTIPTVNNATLTIQRNGTTIDTFTANASVDKTININTADDTKIPLAGSNAISGDLIPSTDGTVNLGGPSYQWNQAYIKSLTINGVACGDILTHNASEFVDVTGNQTVGGTKTFSALRTYFGRDISCYSVRKYGKNLNPTSNTYQYLNFSGNTVADGSTNDWPSGYLEQVVDTNGGSRGRWFVQDTSENAMGIELWASGNDKQVRPFQNGNTDLGTANRKWKSLNGINPGALSLPDTGYINLDITSFDVTATTIGTFTATVDGWAILSMSQKNKPFGIWLIAGSFRATYQSVHHGDDYMIFALIPVRTGVNMNVYCTADDIDSTRKIDWVRLFPCKGNV